VGIALSSDSDEELDASGPEGPKRFDPNCPQGKSYTRQQFIVAYGGTTEWDVAGMANASSRGVMQHQGTTSSLDRLKDQVRTATVYFTAGLRRSHFSLKGSLDVQSKKRKTDAIFESMNAGDGWQHSDALGFTETHVVARSRERLKLRRRPMQVANQNDRLRARGEAAKALSLCLIILLCLVIVWRVVRWDKRGLYYLTEESCRAGRQRLDRVPLGINAE
jgi:hypothetical protein